MLAIIAIFTLVGSVGWKGSSVIANTIGGDSTGSPAQLLNFTVHEEGLDYTISSNQETVGEALTAHGVRIGIYDSIRPAANTPLTAGLNIYIKHATPIEFAYGGSTQTSFTLAYTVREMLAERGITVGPLDRLTPSPDTVLRQGLKVSLVTVREETVVEESRVARPVIYAYDSSLAYGKRYISEAGSDGMVHREFRILTEDGREVSRTLLSESSTPATDQVWIIGTLVAARTTPAAGVACGGYSYSSTMSVYATWYTAESAGGSVTATGAPLAYGVVAVDPRVIPLGTRMCIPGYGIGVALDTGGGVAGNMIDLAYGSCCTGYTTIYILD
ncbi:MAG TPA: ubiquitin-like domain-containing protein [Dehalococcoidia bacterium]|nr:ubiquitin-like domain-containing protein [Dehalococcoidia bacterium]